MSYFAIATYDITNDVQRQKLQSMLVLEYGAIKLSDSVYGIPKPVNSAHLFNQMTAFAAPRDALHVIERPAAVHSKQAATAGLAGLFAALPPNAAFLNNYVDKLL